MFGRRLNLLAFFPLRFSAQSTQAGPTSCKRITGEQTVICPSPAGQKQFKTQAAPSSTKYASVAAVQECRLRSQRELLRNELQIGNATSAGVNTRQNRLCVTAGGQKPTYYTFEIIKGCSTRSLCRSASFHPTVSYHLPGCCHRLVRLDFPCPFPFCSAFSARMRC